MAKKEGYLNMEVRKGPVNSDYWAKIRAFAAQTDRVVYSSFLFFILLFSMIRSFLPLSLLPIAYLTLLYFILIIYPFLPFSFFF